jgi:hypothetical protein
LDLGLVEADGELSGWGCVVQGISGGTGMTVDLDCLWLIPAEMYGRAMMRSSVFSEALITSDMVTVLNPSGPRLKPASYVGDYVQLPVGTSRLAARISAAGLVSSADSLVSQLGLSVQLRATPRFLVVPEPEL